jgi:hypothetical protein
VLTGLLAYLAMNTLLPAGASGDSPAVGTKVGQLHPPILLPSLDGKCPVSLSQFAGKKVLLVQFASW